MASKGQVDAVFLARVGDLATTAAGKAAAARGTGQRPWATPQGWSGDPGDIAGVTAAYDRTGIDQNYGSLLADGNDPGTAGDCISVKTQSDYVALQERAFRTRLTSSVRCMAHAAARWRGHGDPRGIFRDVLPRYVQDAIKAGGGR